MVKGLAVFLTFVITIFDANGQIKGKANTCSYSQNVLPGNIYRINNPSFPQKYTPGSTCQWHMFTAPNYLIRLTCSHVQMPMVNGNRCLDYLLVSVNGNPNDGQVYCIDFTFESTELLVTLFSNRSFFSWDGGTFSCNVMAVQMKQPDDKNTCECGWSSGTRIVGGYDTQPNEFPSMAAVVDIKMQEAICGSTIISERIALTAAHCLSKNSLPEDYGLLVGDHDLTTAEETNATAYYKLAVILRHENSAINSGGNDIALLITSRNIKFNIQVGPACLPFSIDKNDFIGKYVIATGWGTTSFGGPRSQILQKVTLQVVADKNCEAYKEKFNNLRHICTYAPKKDACQFDSGGPLYYYDPQRHVYVLVGIINSGFGCASEIPSLSINVHHYIPWILKYIPSNSFCRKS